MPRSMRDFRQSLRRREKNLLEEKEEEKGQIRPQCKLWDGAVDFWEVFR